MLGRAASKHATKARFTTSETSFRLAPRLAPLESCTKAPIPSLTSTANLEVRMRAFVAALGLVVLPAFASAQAPCMSAQPGSGWVCVNGGWLPPGHPNIPPQTPAPAPPTIGSSPYPPPPTRVFKVGKRYQRHATDIYIAGVVMLESGDPALIAQCMAVGDDCFAVGYIRWYPVNVNAYDWTEVSRR